MPVDLILVQAAAEIDAETRSKGALADTKFDLITQVTDAAVRLDYDVTIEPVQLIILHVSKRILTEKGGTW